MKLLKGVEAMLTPVFEDRKLTLSTHADIPVLYGDEPLLTSLICNLAENGARASQEGDTVWVRIGCDEHPWIEVRDTGIGIPPDQLSRIFEPFYRVDPSRSRKSGGAGLGLSLCAAIVQCHDATLNVDSTPGQGTTVRVDFTNC